MIRFFYSVLRLRERGNLWNCWIEKEATNETWNFLLLYLIFFLKKPTDAGAGNERRRIGRPVPNGGDDAHGTAQDPNAAGRPESGRTQDLGARNHPQGPANPRSVAHLFLLIANQTQRCFLLYERPNRKL